MDETYNQVIDSTIETSRDLDQIAGALSLMQAQVDNVIKDTANPFYKSKYADLASVWDAIRVPLTSNGLALIQLPVVAPSGFVGLHTRMIHKSGQYIGATAYIPAELKAQGYGSGLTYLRRYAAMAIVGVAPDDDDGNAAMPVMQAAPKATGILPAQRQASGTMTKEQWQAKQREQQQR